MTNIDKRENSRGDCITQFLSAAKEGNNSAVLGAYLGQSTKEKFVEWIDENGLDVMHNCITNDCQEAVQVLFKKGYFLRPYEPKSYPYLHLACWLGRRTIINLIVQNRQEDDRLKVELNTDALSLMFGENKYYSENYSAKNKENSEKSELLPLDVAARCGYTQCVELLIDQCVVKLNPDYTDSGRLALATLAGSAAASRLLLQDSPTHKELKTALQLAIHKAKYQCLNEILAHDKNNASLLGKTNLFHVLYTYSSGSTFDADSYQRLPNMTSVLIKHGCKIKAHNIPNTYPIYSLLRNSVSYHGYRCTPHYLQSLKLLLKAGADPNFNEVRNEKALNRGGVATLAGRCSYSSALHCLFETVETYADFLDTKDLAAKFLMQFTDMLVRYSAAVNKAGRIGDKTSDLLGSILHQYSKTSVALGVDIDILKFLLREGADPDIKIQGKYALNMYFDILFAKLKNIPMRKQQPDVKGDIDGIMELCRHMDKPSLRDALTIFLKDHGKSPPEQIRRYFETVSSELHVHVNNVTSLQRLCKLCIWRYCTRNAKNVGKLPLKISLRTYILPTV